VGLFSRTLEQEIGATLAAENQVILFLNRRGAATLIVCRECGYTARCRRCDVPFVFHADRRQLVCHHCSRAVPVPAFCPSCWSKEIRYYGFGTQTVEAEVQRLFPQARVVRWDRDTTRKRASHDLLLQRFLRGEADVLVGTQMIAKGLDLPRVALVGIVAADLALGLPDFRSAERTFQLLTQVAGRAGRGSRPGKVVVQTYNPQHHCIQAASAHDYEGFYRQETAFRATNHYPPFSELARLVYTHSSEVASRAAAESLASRLRSEIARQGLPDLEVIGPAPDFRQRLRGHFRWHILVRGGDLHQLLDPVTLPRGWTLDMDPISLL
jgi:primosomal protein N' (replication factor Y) (superfamily II helicase)